MRKELEKQIPKKPPKKNKLDPIYNFFYYLFNEWLYSYQLKIAHAVIRDKKKRVVITASTRAGKSYVVAMVAIVKVMLNSNNKVYIIAPTSKQAHIIMEYIYSFVSRSDKIMKNTVMTDTQKRDRMGKKMTFDHITFKNGSSIRVLSGEGKGERLLGHGVGAEGGMVIVDESPLIEDSTFTGRIMRMLGDNPDAQLVEIGNPITINHFYDHFHDDMYEKITIPWWKCVAEGRLSLDFIEEQKKSCTPAEFKILYEAEFVDEVMRYYPLDLLHQSLHPNRVEFYDLKNSIIRVGIDFARTRDLTAISIVERVGEVQYQRQMITLKGYSFPQQREFLDNMFRQMTDAGCLWEARLDMTGIGWGITEELQSKFQRRIKGINFGSHIAVPTLDSTKKKVSEVIALNMKMQMYDNKFYLLNEPELVKDFEQVPEDLDLDRNERGHFDMFIASGLSALPDNFSNPNSKMIKSITNDRVASGIGSYLNQNPHLMNNRQRPL